jgi:hypothetical protein
MSSTEFSWYATALKSKYNCTNTWKLGGIKIFELKKAEMRIFNNNFI